MKHKYTYTPMTYLGACHRCNETHLAERFGDALIEGKPVCAACQRNPQATERSEGARPSDSAAAVAP